jgi:hypothetical protein
MIKRSILALLAVFLALPLCATTNFPTSIDTYADKNASDVITSAGWNNMQDAIEALEAKVGADSSAESTSHDYKIDALEADVTALEAYYSSSGVEVDDLTLLHEIGSTSGVVVSDMTLLHEIATSSGITNDIMTNLVSISNTGGYSNFSDEYSATSNTATTTLTQLNVSAGDKIFVEASVLVVGASAGDSVVLSIGKTSGDSATIKFVYNLNEIVQNSPDGGNVHISGIAQVTGSGTLRLKSLASNGASYSSNQIYAFFLKKL